MTGSAKESRAVLKYWIASSLALLAMTDYSARRRGHHEHGDLADLLERTAHIAGLPADLRRAQARDEREHNRQHNRRYRRRRKADAADKDEKTEHGSGRAVPARRRACGMREAVAACRRQKEHQ